MTWALKDEFKESKGGFGANGSQAEEKHRGRRTLRETRPSVAQSHSSFPLGS